MQLRHLACVTGTGAVALIVFACGTSDTEVQKADGGAAGGDAAAAADAANDSAADAVIDAPIDTSGSYTCGAATCASGEYCIHPCGGGVLPMCLAEDGAGGCGAGVRGMCLGDGGPISNGCVPAPPPPYCDTKRECPNGMSTQSGTTRDVSCLCA